MTTRTFTHRFRWLEVFSRRCFRQRAAGCCDYRQTAIPTDAVDDERIQSPRTWDITELTRFILFIGPCSFVFDYSTYFLMLYVFKCWDVSTPEAAAHSQSLFQTGWFVESLLTQTLIIHVIRTNKVPFLQRRASVFLVVVSSSFTPWDCRPSFPPPSTPTKTATSTRPRALRAPQPLHASAHAQRAAVARKAFARWARLGVGDASAR